MKNVSPALKLVVLFTSGTLLATFVAYRAGALDNLIGTRVNAELPVDSPVVETDSGALHDVLPSSKSGVIFEPGPAEPAADTTGPDQSEMWKSSKSLSPVFKPDDISIIAPSSKSAPVWTPQDHQGLQRVDTTSNKDKP